jgi:tRNA-2-methylthio-N6-dimethylallyladenosine synthase
MSKKLHVKTYGCQMNVYDSIRMQDLMIPYGYKVSEDFNEDIDMVILNTCHIREKAAEKVYSELGRVNKIKQSRKKDGKDTLVVVAGCVGQAEGDEIFTRAPYVDIVVGPQSYHTLPDLVAKIARDHKHLIELDFIEEDKFDKLPELVGGQGVSAFVSVQEGCDKFCTFCVVPYTRGAEFSRPLEKIYREVLSAVSNGAKDIMLLGQNVNAYHGKTSEDKECNLADLIEYISEIKGLERIRYMTSHPRDMHSKLISLHGTNEKLMPFLHLPVQSGSNRILKSMNRKHTREEYFAIIDRLRDARSDIVFSSDFIVGFPGETDEDFADTLDLVKRVRYGQCFSFKYSPRPGTPASTKPQVPEKVKDERLQVLQSELLRQQEETNRSLVGKTVPVLFERLGKYKGHVTGRTPYYQSVFVVGHDESIVGKTLDVKIENAEGPNLQGKIVTIS